MPVPFPPFRVENCTPLEEVITLREMRQILSHGGFKIHQIVDSVGQLLHFDVCPSLLDGFFFEVDLPEGWSIVDGYNEYGIKDPEYKHLLDARGFFRGRLIHYSWRGSEIREGTLFCRYALDPLNGIVYRKGEIVDTVYDRTAVKHSMPSKFPVIIHQDSRPPKKGPFGPPSQEMLERFKKHGEAEIERIRAGKPRDDLPICRWLNEHYPDWQDPFAYWDNK